MMNKSFPVTLLCTTLFALSGFGQSSPLPTTDDAYLFEARINAWMEPYRHEKNEEFDEWLLTAMEGDPIAVREHPIVKHMQDFVAQHQNEYIRLRHADLARYPSVGAHLSDYELAGGFQDGIRKELEGGSGLADDELNRMQDLTNYRSLHVSSLKIILSMAKSFVFDHLSENRGTTIADFSLNSIFGEKVFVDNVDGDRYRITFLNRLYALQCDWDIRTNRITIPQLYVYSGKKQAQGWLAGITPTAMNTQQLIETKLKSIVWALHDEMEPDMDQNTLLDKLDAHLERFYRDNHSLYVDTRHALLSGHPTAVPEKWAEYEHNAREAEAAVLAELQPIADKGGHSLPLHAAVYALDATGTALTIENATIWEGRKRHPNDMKQWLLGLEIHTREIEGNLWEIHYFFDNFASKYTWDITTDEISGFIIKSK